MFFFRYSIDPYSTEYLLHVYFVLDLCFHTVFSRMSYYCCTEQKLSVILLIFFLPGKYGFLLDLCKQQNLQPVEEIPGFYCPLAQY